MAGNKLIEVRRWKTSGGVDGRAKNYDVNSSELVARLRAARTIKQNKLVDTQTSLQTVAAHDWNLHRSKVNWTERGLFILYGGAIYEIEELLPDEKNRTRRIIRTREKERVRDGVF